MIIEKYPDGSMEILLCMENQNLGDLPIRLPAMQEVIERFNRSQYPWATEYNTPRREPGMSPEEWMRRTASFVYNKQCGIITEMYLYPMQRQKRMALTAVWTPYGPYREQACRMMSFVKNAHLTARVLVRSYPEVGRIIGWDFCSNYEYYSRNPISEIIVDDINAVRKSRYRNTAPAD